MILKIIVLGTLIFVIRGTQGIGLKVVPESAKVLYKNDKYIKWGVFNIRRYQRKGDYYINISGYIYHTWANNVTIFLALTEYLHNEYRPSFIQLDYKLCDFINKEPFIGGMVKHTGLTCPVSKGEHKLMNMTVLSGNFPNVFPFTKGGANIEFKLTDTGEYLAKVEVHAKFIHNRE